MFVDHTNMQDFMLLPEVFTLLGCYTVLVTSQLPMLWDSISVPFSKVKQSSKTGLLDCLTAWPLKIGQIVSLNIGNQQYLLDVRKLCTLYV